ncbi:BOLA class I histocompatibility antigen, alpha chain BL3-7-like [Ictalurus furcatus]|uniref:BOLA class I histocompatibility antigen, alpha chain BL3-7-like n=1 Tax=Ictalurus furcatus TaxID=66913 RepID=UPI00234FE19B|nr:BOLA class I histocompatibility antigen, alpha chain BL3-7-like [Ictalurus furcatus]
MELRETLPNQDGSFQKRSILTVSAEDLQKHTCTCVIQHSSLEKDMVLNEEDIRILNPDGGSGRGSGGGWIGVVVVLIIVGGGVGIVCWKKTYSDFTRVPDSDCERPSEVTSDLLVHGVTTASLPSQIRSESVKIFNVYNKLTTKLTK